MAEVAVVDFFRAGNRVRKRVVQRIGYTETDVPRLADGEELAYFEFQESGCRHLAVIIFGNIVISHMDRGTKHDVEVGVVQGVSGAVEGEERCHRAKAVVCPVGIDVAAGITADVLAFVAAFARLHAYVEESAQADEVLDLNIVEGGINGSFSTDGNKQNIASRLETSLPDLWEYDSYTKTDDYRYCYPEKLDFEGALSFGWTIKACDYLFGTVGLGYHGGGFNTFDFKKAPSAIGEAIDEKETLDRSNIKPFELWEDELRHKCTKAQWFNGADLEAGLIFKIWHMNLKGTYQYTYWINDNNYTDFLKDNRMRFFIGLGFNW